MMVSWYHLLLLCVAAFCAGFVDAIVGGGGLIQLPAALVILPQFGVASVIASLKIPSFTGTAAAVWQYKKRIKTNGRLVAILCTTAFVASFGGSYLLSRVSNRFMKPVLLVVLLAVAVYTYLKKDLGLKEGRPQLFRKLLLPTLIVAVIIGFYDGFIGPGAGSFFILAFVTFLHFDFLRASVYAKLANLATNLGSITLFLAKGKIIWAIAVPMAAANAAGGFVGARVAIAKGNRFIRVFFLIIVAGVLLRFCWDVFKP